MESSNKISSEKNKFLKLNPEKKEFNQYWFSEKTIDFIVNQIAKKHNLKNKDDKFLIALIACPSVFFSLPNDIQNDSYLFDIDEKFSKKNKNAIVFDFNKYDDIKEFNNYFDMVVIDPPFVTKEAWEKFSNFTKMIIKENGYILTCSLYENSEMLNSLLGLKIRNFQPSIPHLVYQYNFYSNYEDCDLNEKNNELVN